MEGSIADAATCSDLSHTFGAPGVRPLATARRTDFRAGDQCMCLRPLPLLSKLSQLDGLKAHVTSSHPQCPAS
jgi:hypothetical protein